MPNIIESIILLIQNKKLSLQKEKVLQVELEEIFTQNKLYFKREYRLNQNNIIDFYFPNEKIGLEIKIKGDKAKILEQLERYSRFDEIEGIFLLTNRSVISDGMINNKNLYVYSLGNTYL